MKILRLALVATLAALTVASCNKKHSRNDDDDSDDSSSRSSEYVSSEKYGSSSEYADAILGNWSHSEAVDDKEVFGLMSYDSDGSVMIRMAVRASGYENGQYVEVVGYCDMAGQYEVDGNNICRRGMRVVEKRVYINDELMGDEYADDMFDNEDEITKSTCLTILSVSANSLTTRSESGNVVTWTREN